MHKCRDTFEDLQEVEAWRKESQVFDQMHLGCENVKEKKEIVKDKTCLTASEGQTNISVMKWLYKCRCISALQCVYFAETSLQAVQSTF